MTRFVLTLALLAGAARAEDGGVPEGVVLKAVKMWDPSRNEYTTWDGREVDDPIAPLALQPLRV